MRGLLIALAGVAMAQAAPRAAAPTLFAAGDGDGLWVVRVVEDGKFVVSHRTTGDKAGVLRPALRSGGRPIAAAGTGKRLDLVYAGGTAQSVRFRFDAQLNLPRFEVNQHPPLPPGVRVLDLAAAESSPVLLVRRDRRDDEDPRRELLSPAGVRWHATALPEAIDDDAPIRLIAGGATLTLLARDADGSLTAHRHADDRWTARPIDLTVSERFAAAHAWGQLLIIDPTDDDRLALRLVDRDRVLDAGRIAPPPDADADTRWIATGYADHAALLFDLDPPTLVMRDLRRPPDARPATLSLRVEPWPAWATNQQYITYGLFFVLLVTMVLALRPGNRPWQIKLPDTLAIAPMSRRVAALAIDLAPAMILTMAIVRIADPLAVLGPWLSFSDNWAAKVPALLVVAITCVHGTVGEMIAGQSLGKRLVGIRVTDYEGRRPGIGAIAARNAVKLLELLLWPLALTVVLSPTRQRMGDQAARTLVAHDAPPPQPDEQAEDARE